MTGPVWLQHHRLWENLRLLFKSMPSSSRKPSHRQPACVVTMRHLKRPKIGRQDGVSYEFGESQKWGLYCFLRQGERVHMPFLLLCRFLFNLVINIYCMYITFNIKFSGNCNHFFLKHKRNKCFAFQFPAEVVAGGFSLYIT